MSSEIDGYKVNDETEWSPALITTPPLFSWPLRPFLILKYVFGYPGYFLPRNICYMALALVTWFFLIPNLESMQTFNIEWVSSIYFQNLALMFLVFGGWHFRFYILKAQKKSFRLINDRHKQNIGGFFLVIKFTIICCTVFLAAVLFGQRTKLSLCGPSRII